MATLAEIRARLQAQDNRSKGRSTDNLTYPHWNIPENTSAKVRFLPDGNTTNDFFWKEVATIRLPFSGIKGVHDSKPTEVRVPCIEMWGDACPILAEVRPWFADNSLEELARKYWKKRSYLFQGFVRQNPMVEENVPENPIRKFNISTQVFNIIKASLMDPEIEENPTSYDRGLDFSINKTTKGQYADYSTSTWARKESALTESERAAIEAFGLFDLNDFMPKRPNQVELQVMVEMFEASVDGQEYDPDRWANYFKPIGFTVNKVVDEHIKSTTSTTNKVSSAPVNNYIDDDEEIDTTPKPDPVVVPNTTTNDKAADILKKIRERQGQK